MRPPRPDPRTVTVVSPPESRTQGGGAGWPWRRTWSAMPASTLATSRASPSSASPRIMGAMPAARALAAAASSDACGRATMMVSAPARRGSPGLGVSSRASCRCFATAAGGSMRYWRRIARASAKVVGSGTVGPEPITAGSSPGTSEIRRLTTRAGCAAAAKRPPLIAERCFRTAFIWVMSAPEASSARLTACLSSSVRPSAGSASSADAPPEIRHSTRSSAPARFAYSRIRPRGGAAGGVRHRMRRLDHLDPGARHGVAVAGDHEAFERPGHVPLDRARHRRRGLAGAEHDGAAGGRRRQMRRQHRGRLRRFDRGVQQPAQEGSRLDRHPGPVATAASTDRRCAVSRSPRHCLPA